MGEMRKAGANRDTVAEFYTRNRGGGSGAAAGRVNKKNSCSKSIQTQLNSTSEEKEEEVSTNSRIHSSLTHAPNSTSPNLAAE